MHEISPIEKLSDKHTDENDTVIDLSTENLTNSLADSIQSNMDDPVSKQQSVRFFTTVRRRWKMPLMNQMPSLQCKLCMRSFRRPAHLANHLKMCDSQGTDKDVQKE
jgi:hypothetical protein